MIYGCLRADVSPIGTMKEGVAQHIFGTAPDDHCVPDKWNQILTPRQSHPINPYLAY